MTEYQFLDLSDIVSELKQCKEILEKTKQKRVWNLVELGEPFLKVLLHPKIKEIAGARNFTISSFGSNKVENDGYKSRWHKDWPYFPDKEVKEHDLCVEIVIPLVDFRKENGATKYIPNSSQLSGHPEPYKDYSQEEQYFECAVGTAFVFNGELWHSAGTNTTQEPRYALLINLIASHVEDMDIIGSKKFIEYASNVDGLEIRNGKVWYIV